MVLLRSALFALIALASAASVGCGAKAGGGAVEYSVSAQQNYDKGLSELKDDDWIAAAKYFAFIRARFPYSRYAVLAELRLADAEFGAAQYLQAVDSYKMFEKLHPTHDMVANGYTAFRIGECYYKMLPEDWWILPPSYEKDQSATTDAERELRNFLRKYPSSQFVARAQKMVIEVARRLAEHEWYVASFYWKRDKPMGTVLRLRRLLDRYAGAGYDADALWLLGRAYVKVGMPDRAKTTWQKLIDEHPKHKNASEARAALGKLPS